MGEQKQWPPLRHAVIVVCQDCLDNVPGVCRTPGCIQWIRSDIEGELGERLDFKHQYELASDLIAQERAQAAKQAYEDCGSKAGTGPMVRGYAKTRTKQYTAQLQADNGEGQA
jgi:hypothetical protein